MRYVSLVASVSLLLLGLIALPFPLPAQSRLPIVDQDGRQLPGERAARVVERRYPDRRGDGPQKGRGGGGGCRNSSWSFSFGLGFSRPLFCCPPARPIIYCAPPTPEIVFVTPPPPPVVRCTEGGSVPRNTPDRDMRRLKLSSSEGKGDQIRLDGRHESLESIDIEVDGPRQRLELDGQFPKLTHVDVDSDSGNIWAKLRGRFPKLEQMTFSSRSGLIDLDLTGRWKQNCAVEIENRSGEVHLRLPDDVGVIVSIEGLCERRIPGRYTCRGDSRVSRQYVNARYGYSDVTLAIRIDSMDGKVVID